MKELLTYIIQSLVENPDEVSVTERKAEGETVFEVRVAEGDMGKVIGRQGRIVTASSNSCIFFPPSSLFLLRNRSVPSQLLFYIKYTVYAAFVQDFFQIPALLFSSSEPEGPHFSEITFHTPFSR